MHGNQAEIWFGKENHNFNNLHLYLVGFVAYTIIIHKLSFIKFL